MQGEVGLTPRVTIVTHRLFKCHCTVLIVGLVSPSNVLSSVYGHVNE